MSELEQKAAEAWSLMFSWAMPAGIAIDFVQEATDDRAKARERIVWHASLALGRARLAVLDSARSAHESDAAHESAVIGGLVFAGLTEAGHRLAVLRSQIVRVLERSPEWEEAAAASRWLDWCADARKTVELCRELLEAANPAPA